MSENKINPFKELQRSLKSVPPEMRRKVMNDVAIAKLFMDMTFLFTKNYPSTMTGLFKTNNKKKYN